MATDSLDLISVLAYVRYELSDILSKCTSFKTMRERTMFLLAFLESREMSFGQPEGAESDEQQNDAEIIKSEVIDDEDTLEDTDNQVVGFSADNDDIEFHHIEWKAEALAKNGKEDHVGDESKEDNTHDKENKEEGETTSPRNKASTCDFCDKKFTTRSGLLKHRKLHTGIPSFTCWWCNENFKRKDEYKLHLVRAGHINIAGKKVDEKGLIGENELTKYMKKLQTCETCGKIFDKQSAYRKHMRAHRKRKANLGEAPANPNPHNQCNFCGKKFKSRSGLIKHRKLHSGLHPFTCSWCKKAFKRREDIKLHLVREGHINLPDKKKDEAGLLTEEELNDFVAKILTCEFCDKIFDRESSFRSHMKVHVNDVPGEPALTTAANATSPTTGNTTGIATGNTAANTAVNATMNASRNPGQAKGRDEQDNSETFLQMMYNDSYDYHYKQRQDQYGNKDGQGQPQGAGNGGIDDNTLADLVSKYSGNGEPERIRPYSCPFCPFSTYQPGRLKEHERKHTGERPFECEKCQRRFTLERSLKLHQKLHETDKKFECETCKKKFTCRSHLVAHEYHHTGISKFNCATCTSSFSTKAGLQRHMNFHLGKKDHICDKCGKAFYAKSELSGHIRLHHRKRVYNFKCEICDKAFIQRGDLNKHMTVHSDSKPFMCASCGKGFSRKTYLTKHMIIHSPDKPYKCNTCNKQFSFVSNLVTHERIHTGEKPYACDVCGKRSSDVANHIKHMKAHNGDRPTSVSKHHRQSHINRGLAPPQNTHSTHSTHSTHNPHTTHTTHTTHTAHPAHSAHLNTHSTLSTHSTHSQHSQHSNVVLDDQPMDVSMNNRHVVKFPTAATAFPDTDRNRHIKFPATSTPAFPDTDPIARTYRNFSYLPENQFPVAAYSFMQ